MKNDPSKKQSKNIATVSNSKLEGEIRCRAYELYQARGCEEGYDVEDWLRAEAEVASNEEVAPVAA